MNNFKPVRDPAQRICKFCGKPNATKWDGGLGGVICWTNKPWETLTAAQYCCEECDSRNKWFDLTNEDFEDGLVEVQFEGGGS